MSNRPQRTSKEQASSPIRKGRLNDFELAGIALFMLCLFMYSLSKCFKENTTKMQETEMIAADSSSNQYESNVTVRRQLPPRIIDTSSFKTKLYVLVDSLRLRSEPNIGGELLTYLRLGDALTDLGERTLHEKIRISADELKVAPWIKVATQKGIEGWAFGGCLQFYPLPEQATGHLNSQESSHQH